jgi:signal transduction histidine kinase
VKHTFKNLTRSHLTRVLLHVLIWSGLLAIPAVFSYLRGMPGYNFHFAVLPASCMVIFYLNYAWLIDRYFFPKKILRFIAVNLLCIVLLGLFEHVLRSVFFDLSMLRPLPAFADRMPLPHRPGVPFFANTILLALVVSAGLAIKATTRWYRAQAAMAMLEKEKSAAELQQLRSQLNPHFFFNSLNNIYALVAFDPAQAQLAIHTLGDMLRHQLYEATQEKIPLRKEVDFIRNYCRIMQLRLSPNVTVTLDLPDDGGGVLIAPLIFVPLVENAFKHGVSPPKPSHIAISIAHTGRSLVCTVRNSFFPKAGDPGRRPGIGLENLRRRLDLLYPGKYRWKAGAAGQEFITEITLHHI